MRKILFNAASKFYSQHAAAKIYVTSTRVKLLLYARIKIASGLAVNFDRNQELDTFMVTAKLFTVTNVVMR